MTDFLSRLDDILSHRAVTISGLGEGEKSFLPSFLIGRSVIVTHDKDALEKYRDNISSLNKRVVCIEDKLPLIISMNDTNSTQYKEYILSLTRLATGDYDVLVITSDVLFQTLPRREYFLDNILSLKVGERHDLSALQSMLVKMGYKRQEMVAGKGDFAIRGDIVDIYPVNMDNAVRVSFFDDEIEDISLFDCQTFKTADKIEKLNIFCATMLSISSDEREIIESKVKAQMSSLSLSGEAMIRLSEISSQQLEYLSSSIPSLSNVFFLPFLDYFDSSILDYLDDDTSLIFDEPKLITDRLDAINEQNISSFLDLSVKGEFLPIHMNFYRDRKDILSNISRFRLIAFSRLLRQNRIFNSDTTFSFICPSVRQYHNHFVDLMADIKNYLKNGYQVALSYRDDLTLSKLESFLQDDNITYHLDTNLPSVKKDEVILVKDSIYDSVHFEMERLIVIGSSSLNPHVIINSREERHDKVKFLPKVGEYVVHEVHGIGKCLGIQNLKISSAPKDYIIIEYKDGDILYLPSENADMLSPYYAEGDVKCNKIGGTDFFKVKQKVKSSVKEMAFDLIKVYSQRMNSKGYVYSEDSYLQKAFEDAFPYQYTEDQLSAIQDIKRDMQSNRIMDRLICGDVGFGKTEVALISAFKAIQDGKQVAIICPTTILCEQHFATATSRMKDFFVRVEAINRFKTKREQEDILKRLGAGEIDLICGTHRLLSQDVHFKDLGLIIIDEEQRFGVEDKEKLKNMKSIVDVLSLSATPIPRTMYMSLSGMRDVSYLSTPPQSRKKVKTAVIDYSDSLLEEVCRKELDRGGQVLIVYNKVESIASFYSHVKTLLKDARIDFAHGQMDSRTLENAIYNLYSRKTQILISTILIENGIDLPHANTLFVVDADKLGLSQLYQLRGRIGRSDVEAYAYFSFKRNKPLTIDAYKRLDAIMEFSDFGSGFKVAMRDLEIRGAGDVLGRFQHGHMLQVGYDMYIKLLNEAVSEIKGEKVMQYREVKINISLGAFVPENYISSSEGRISLYSSIARIETEEELRAIISKTEDIYGALPKPVRELCIVGFIKNLARQSLAMSVTLDDFCCRVIFYDDVKDTPLYDYIRGGGAKFSFVSGGKIAISIKKEKDTLSTQDNLISVLKELSSIIQERRSSPS